MKKNESVAAIDEIRQQIELLSARLSVLEALQAAPPAPAVKPAPAPAPVAAPAPAPAPAAKAPVVEEGINEELVLVLSAAIAAYLGKVPHIRQIRLIRSPAWAQQGRVTIQASHMIALNRG